jgi:hypothetical protein
MNAIIKEKSVELFAFIIAAVLQLLRALYEYAFLCTPSPTLCQRPHPPAARYVVFADTESVKDLMLGDIIVNVIFVSIYIPLVFFVKKTFGWLFFRCSSFYYCCASALRLKRGRVVGGDMQMRSVYVIFEVFVSIQKFSVLITLMFW